MKFAWSDATKTTAHAISSGRPNRWSGTSRAAWAIIAGVFHTSSTPSVSTGPEATAFTRIPYQLRAPPAAHHHVRADLRELDCDGAADALARAVTIATRSRSVSGEKATLLDDRVRCRQNPRDLDLFAIDHG